MATPDKPQPLTLFEAVLPVASLIVLVALSYYLFGDAGAAGPNQVALVVATMIAVFIAWRRGHTLEPLREAASYFGDTSSPLSDSANLAAAGTPTSALIPWNSCGAYMAGTLGVATLSYLPYAVFNFASPLLAIAVTVIGLRVLHTAPRAAGPRRRRRSPVGVEDPAHRLDRSRTTEGGIG